MICKICNCEFKAITNTHLKKHGITMQEYSLMYGVSCLNENQTKKGLVPWNKGKKGLQKAYNKGSCKVDHSYFKRINCNMFYTLGLMFADGCIRRDRKGCKIISLSLNINDIDIIEKVKDDMCLHKDICISMDKRYENKGQAVITIYSEEIYDDMVSFGCIERKSLVLEFPNINNPYLKHFIRGYFDGDGSVFITRGSLNVSFTSGSFNFLEGLIYNINKELDIKAKIYSKSSKNTCYFINYRGDNAIRLCGWLYDDAKIFMDRKYKKYKSFIKER